MSISFPHPAPSPQSAIRTLPSLLCFLFLLVAPVGARADDIPLVGRPIEFPFSGASAGFVRQGDDLLVPFRLEASVSQTRVEVEQPITFTVSVHALAPPRQPPRRLDLREVPAFARRFHIEDAGTGTKERPTPNAWRWQYHLRPRQVGIHEVPGVPFVFYNPDLRPADRAFQVLFTDPIRLTVTPPEVRRPDNDLPDSVLDVAGGPGLFARDAPWHGPEIGVLVAVLGLPPLVGAGWYLAWRRLYPDAGRLARQRRSRAARRALAALAGADRLAGRARAEAVSGAVVLYLRERFDLVYQEPTPGESAEWLARFGIAGSLTERLGQLLQRCAAGRFGPVDEEDSDLPALARGLVLELEDATCPSS